MRYSSEILLFGKVEASTTSQCSTNMPLTTLYTSADFMLIFLRVCLFVATLFNLRDISKNSCSISLAIARRLNRVTNNKVRQQQKSLAFPLINNSCIYLLNNVLLVGNTDFFLPAIGEN